MPFDWITSELHALEAAGLRRQTRECVPLPRGRCRVDGLDLVNFASNDYLGLASDPRVIASALDATTRYGAGSRASALVSGRTPLHAKLEDAIAQFEGTEAAVLFPTGFAANVGAIGSLVGAGDVVLCDRLNHASLVDGCRLSGARLRVYSHGGGSERARETIPFRSAKDRSVAEQKATVLTQLANELAKASNARRRLIVTDSIFSMDGDGAPLAEIAELATRTQSMLLIDEAHATGVYGATGRGWCEEIGLDDSQCVRVGTLSKAIGSQGGFVAGTQQLCDWIRNTARTQMFSTSLTPGACGAALAALRIIQSEPDRRERVRLLATQLRTELLMQTSCLASGELDCPIVTLIVGEPQVAVDLSQHLAEQGFLVPAIRPPTVPKGTSRVRISLTTDHAPEDVSRCVEVLRGWNHTRIEDMNDQASLQPRSGESE